MRTIGTLAVMAAVGLLGSAAVEAQDENPNGFPRGPHYNLNILAKKTGFTGCGLQVDEYGNTVYGNVIYIPESGKNIQILMTSGKGKRAQAATELQVTDPCADFDGDAAELRLPPSANGYKVYARTLAKPNELPMTIIPSLVSAEDEYGNDLVYLGLVTQTGGLLPNNEPFSRSKGKSTAVDISPMFLFTGEVCNIFFDGAATTTKPLCWLDMQPLDVAGHGVIDSADQFFPPVSDDISGVTCAAGEGVLTPVPVSCKTYSEPTWVFNIADFVTYLWDVNNDGLKHLQVRFYPQ